MNALHILRRVALGAVLGAPALAGCADDGYGGKETTQEFEKPASMPTKDVVEPDTYPGEESPRERRSALKGEG